MISLYVSFLPKKIITYSVIWFIQTKTRPVELFLYIKICLILVNAQNTTV